MKIAVVGSFGRLGKVLCEILRENGHSVAQLSREDTESLDETEKFFDWIILSIPVSSAKQIIEKFEHIDKFIEIGSVKEPIRKFRDKIISIHPLFGPRSFRDRQFNNILFIDDISRRNSLGIVREMFPTFNVIPVSAEKHDKDMTTLLIAPYLLSRIAANMIDNSLEYKTSSYGILERLSEMLSDESDEVVSDTIHLNPFALQVTDSLRGAVKLTGSDLR